MVTISIYGLDQYVVGRYSKDHTANIASLLEVDTKDVVFYSPNAYVFHNGVEQTSWNTIVKVNAPEECEKLEDKVANYIIKTLKEFTIHLVVEFTYYHKHHRYEFVNKEYPRYISEENVVNVEDEYEENEEIYDGNMFEGFEEKYAEMHPHSHDEECDCDEHDHDCGEECHCGHKH